MVRKLGKVTYDEWIQEFNPDNVPLTKKLDTLVKSFGVELNHVLDKLAPVKQCKISSKPRQQGLMKKPKLSKEECAN